MESVCRRALRAIMRIHPNAFPNFLSTITRSGDIVITRWEGPRWYACAGLDWIVPQNWAFDLGWSKSGSGFCSNTIIKTSPKSEKSDKMADNIAFPFFLIKVIFWIEN
ncbi:hypothetical protein X798_01997 [Onchocerca flexuosa]|uniref:Uncharacterized protein n=1 Tax=Onchocerca flexuosa TaxID=387005 RepID=A0A238C033_9BILA|nr:hypothetical protein X798_01997 [Onchocerca flexuosa]